MKTPIFDFVKEYASSDVSRFHMPGHKGQELLGIERFDITEINGADVLYSADGIIEESEKNATALFNTAHTYYSTEGSTLAIKAMLSLVVSGSKSHTPPVILAARNVHKAFVNAAAILDFDVEWLCSENGSHICECLLTPADLGARLSQMQQKPIAVYVTSPDYLGNVADIKGLSSVCDEYDIPLLVDNAHGAYLAYLSPSQHPIALGASICVDSAHKTLPVLTGGAYLHISKKCEQLCDFARGTLSVFASTSPSYLILSSLDICNAYIADGYPEKLNACVARINEIKDKYGLVKGCDPLKIVINSNISQKLREMGIECEFSDNDYTVLMASPQNTEEDFERLDKALSIALKDAPQPYGVCYNTPAAERAMSIREAVFSKHETVSVENALGRILGSQTVSCPPAVPIAVSGERIAATHIQIFKAYGIEDVKVVIE